MIEFLEIGIGVSHISFHVRIYFWCLSLRWCTQILQLHIIASTPLSTMFTCRLPQSYNISSSFVARMFSSSPATLAGYKMKSHSGAKKRWRSLASGSDFKRVGVKFPNVNNLHILICE